MEKYGLTDESDKTKAMLITGHWVSKLVVFGMATKDRQLNHSIRPVKRIGYKQSVHEIDINGEYLTGSPRTTISDTGNKLFGRLITYLRIFEPRSELLLYPQLRMKGETREKHYMDYSDQWENILLVILDAISKPTELSVLDAVSKRCSVSNKFLLNADTLKDCWNYYDVNGQTQELIRKSFSSK
uniref:Uncharacterized protein n=1 Tax=Trichobilharzia regenti TaxID=157069 RepID=A0AA85KLE6_TRIRE|nr:unnamed protein product [Trichobilharzia regenti]